MAPIRPVRKWDPRKVLDLDPMAGTFTCVGSAPTKGHVRCRIRIDIMACSAAVEVLNEMTAIDIVRGSECTNELIRLAELLLCQTYHQYQAHEKAQDWFLKIHQSAQEFLEWKELKVENKSLQVEKKKLVEKLALLEEDLAKESEKASQEMSRRTILETMGTAVNKEFADLQGKHAALKEEAAVLRKNQTKLKKENELSFLKLSKVEEEAQEREAELRSELFEAEQKAQEGKLAQEREAELSNKLSKAESIVQEKEAKLKKLFKAKEEAQCKVEELSNELFIAGLKAQDAQYKEAEVGNKLVQTEQEAKDREAQLSNILIQSKQEAQDREAELRNKLIQTERKAQDREAEFGNKLIQIKQDAQVREATISQKLTGSESLLKQSEEKYQALQLKFEELSVKDGARRLKMEAQRSTIFLLQTELRSQQSELKENNRTWGHKESQAKSQDRMGASNDDHNNDGDGDEHDHDHDHDDDDYVSAIWDGPTLTNIAGPSKDHEVAPLTRFEALNSLATYFCS